MAAAGAGSAGSAARGGGGSSAASRWFFSREQLENTPSRRCGVEADKELSYRQQAANLIQDMGQRLNVYPSGAGREGGGAARGGAAGGLFPGVGALPGTLPAAGQPRPAVPGPEPWPGAQNGRRSLAEPPRRALCRRARGSGSPALGPFTRALGRSHSKPHGRVPRNGQLLFRHSLM